MTGELGEDGGLVMETRPRTIGHDPSLEDQRERGQERETREREDRRETRNLNDSGDYKMLGGFMGNNPGQL